MSYKYTQLSGYANIDGIGRVDISRATVQYAVNSLPVASIGVAAGQPVRGGSVQTALLDKLTRMKQMDIYVQASPSSTIPGGKSSMHIFDGVTSSVGLVSEPGLRGIQVNGINWLYDLQSTAAFTSKRTAHAFWELIPAVSMMSSAGITEATLSVEAIASKLAESGGDLYAVLTTLIKYVAGGAATDARFNNMSALTAWKRSVGDLKFAFDAEATVETGVNQEITSGFLSLYESGTIWSTLMALSRSFFFMLVPTVGKVYVVPYTPMLTSPVASLTPADYVYVSQMSQTRKNIAGLVLLDHSSMTASAEMQTKEALSIFVVNESKGVLDGAMLPSWLHGPVLTTTTSDTYATIEGIYGRAPDRIVPKKGESAITKWNKNINKVKAIGNDYAQLVLGDRLFGPNTLSIKGPFRTDIVPGTVISVGIPTDAARSTSELRVYGFVTSVTLEIDAERSLAATTINLSHVRHESDNVKFGSSGNALYTGVFKARTLL